MQYDFVKPLLLWYNAEKRDLPWRKNRDPYRIWVSEIMLQQTRVEAVREYFRRFTEELPDVYALAACPDERLMKLWEGLGYYSRVRNMKKAAGLIVSEYGGRFPEEAEELLKLPGIGSYTAGAVSSIAFGKYAPAVDGNVLRVIARMEEIHDNILLPQVKRRVENELADVMQNSLPGLLQDGFYAGDLTQALIELGALVCAPNRPPDCDNCPCGTFCMAKKKNLTEELPIRLKETKRRIEERTILLVRDGERTAIRRRPDSGLLAGLYEFPGIEGNAGRDEALAFVEKNGFTALQIRELPSAKHLFSHVEWRMQGYEIRISPPEPETACPEWIFAEREELNGKWAVPSAFRSYLKLLGVKRQAE